MHNSQHHIEMLVGKMLLDEPLRKAFSKDIPLNQIESTDLFIIAKALQEEEFSLEHLYLRNNKSVALKAIQMSINHLKNR